VSYSIQETTNDICDKGDLQGSERVLAPENVEADIASIKTRKYGVEPTYCIYWSSRATSSDFGEMVRSDPRFTSTSRVEVYDNRNSESPEYALSLGNFNFGDIPVPLAEKITVNSDEQILGRSILINDINRSLNTVRIDMTQPDTEVATNYFDPRIEDLSEETGNRVIGELIEDQEEHSFEWIQDSRL